MRNEGRMRSNLQAFGDNKTTSFKIKFHRKN